MSDQTTTRLAEIQGRLADLDQANDDDRNRMLALVWHHAPDDLAHLLSLVEQLQGQINERNTLIRDLYDEDLCWFDHHGYCQAHGWFETDPPCPDGRAQALVQTLEAPGDR